MKIAYVLDNTCIEYLIFDSLELAEELKSSIFANYENLNLISVIDAEEESCPGVGAVKINNVWVDKFSAQIIGWEWARAYRDPLLKNSDWTQLPDSPLSNEKKQLWYDYRQQLRNITDSVESPQNVVFPSDPDGNYAYPPIDLSEIRPS